MTTAKKNFIIVTIVALVIIACGVYNYIDGKMALEELSQSMAQENVSGNIGDVEGYALLIDAFQNITYGASAFLAQLFSIVICVYGTILLILGFVSRAIYKNEPERILGYRVITGFVLAAMAIPVIVLIRHIGLLVLVGHAPILELVLFCGDLAACIVVARGTYSPDITV